MPEAHGPVEAGQENEAEVEPGRVNRPELTPQESGADLDAGLQLGAAGADLLSAGQARDAANLPPGLRARAISGMGRHQGNFAVQRMLKHTSTRPLRSVQQRSVLDGDDKWLAGRIEAAHGTGQPIEAQAEARLEAGLHSDLGEVRVHTDPEAAGLASAVDAVAITSGRDIFFSPGTYQPDTSEGLKLLAHEAAHTIQQASGPVEGTLADGGLLVSDPADRFEQAAEAAARAVLAATPAGPEPQPLPATAPTDGDSVQRAELPKQNESTALPPGGAAPEGAYPKEPEAVV